MPTQGPRLKNRRGSVEPAAESDAAFARSLLIHEDAHVLAFDKPSGLAVQGGSGVKESLEDMLGAFAKSNGKRPRLVHRLDRETSGVIVAARTKPAAAALSAAFAERLAKKTYLAIVCGGAPVPDAGMIDLPLRKASRAGLDVMEIGAARQSSTGSDRRSPALVEGKRQGNWQDARTGYKTLAATTEAALLELAPETGRMHQIRAHLAAIGRPIAGDGKYGGLFSLGGVSVPRLMLHASRLEAPHPAGGALSLEAPPPEAFRLFLSALGLRQGDR